MVKNTFSDTDCLAAYEALKDNDVIMLSEDEIERLGFLVKKISEKELENGSLELSIDDKSIIVDKAKNIIESSSDKSKILSSSKLKELFSVSAYNSNSNELLIIVDPQNDFINGSLAVEGADKCMDALTNYVERNNFNQIWVTMDYHPQDHCSFIENGGEWPSHCVEGTEGIKIYQPLKFVLNKKIPHVHLLEKGKQASIEQYSFFDRKDIKAFYKELIKRSSIEQITLCGIMGRVCVLNTLKDLVDMGFSNIIKVLLNFTADDNDNKALIEYCIENNIKFE